MRDMDFSSFGLPGGGGKGYDDLDLGDDDHDYGMIFVYYLIRGGLGLLYSLIK